MILALLLILLTVVSILLFLFRNLVAIALNWLINLYYRIFKKQERVSNYTNSQSQYQSGYTGQYGKASARKEKIFSDSDGEYVDFEEVDKK